MEYKTASRLVYLAAGLFVCVWFLHEILEVILLLFFAIVITIVLNAPVTWMEKRGVKRPIASIIIFFAVLGCFAGLGWMIIPKMVTQVKLLIADLPNYLESLNKQVAHWLGDRAGDSQ